MKALRSWNVGKNKVRGTLYFGKQGRAKVVVEGRDEPISLARGASGTALHGDLVELQVLPPKKKIKASTVIKIVKKNGPIWIKVEVINESAG